MYTTNEQLTNYYFNAWTTVMNHMSKEFPLSKQEFVGRQKMAQVAKYLNLMCIAFMYAPENK